ncbi:MAG: ABC transporter ATP-binding protein [Bdellovibrionia bacterium]
MTIIEISDLKFTYPKKLEPTLLIENLQIQSGERVFLFGPSGSGKTTFLEILAGVLAPQEGKVLIKGQDLAQMSPTQRDHFRSQNIGYVFQSFNLIPYLTVRENILLPLLLAQKSAQEIAGHLEHLTSELGIANKLFDAVSELSVGQQQRVAVARALLMKPSLLLADEPTSALDADHRERFLKLLFSLASEQGTSVVFVSHDRSIQPLFDRSISLTDINRVQQ